MAAAAAAKPPGQRRAAAARTAHVAKAQDAAAVRRAAWRDAGRLLREVFDLPAVLRREKPWASLVGRREVLAIATGIVASSLVMDRWNEMSRRLAATIYMRDTALFLRQTASVAALSIAYSVLTNGTSALYSRVSALWRDALTRKAQARYMRSQAFYHLQNGAIADADQRMTNDISSVMSTLAALCYTAISTSTNAFSSVVRLALAVNPRYVVIVAVYIAVTDWFREWAAPAIEVGVLSGEMSAAMAEYRTSQMKLQENSETILTARGTEFEKTAILSAFGRLREKYLESYALSRKLWLYYSGLTISVVQPGFTALLVQFPFIQAGPREFGSGTEGMQANSVILAEMTFNATLVSRMMAQVRSITTLPRMLLSVSGSAARVVELLDACETLAEESGEQPQCRQSDSIRFENLSLRTPGGEVQLLNDLNLELEPGENLLLVGANGVGCGSTHTFAV